MAKRKNVATHDDTVRLVALGGFGEIGMNCLVLEAARRLLVIDCGVMFPTPDSYGIDVVHPSFEYLVSNRDRIEGVVLTHGHEDHVAAVPYLLREVDVPVYGAPYSLGLINERMKEFDHRGSLVTGRLDPGGKMSTGPFSVESVPMPHSIIDNMGLFIETPAGSILHTGDFKLGLKGTDGGRSTLDRLESFGRRGVDLMIGDSTGAEELEPAGDESEVSENLMDLASRTPGRLFVAIFSSNINRLEALARVAQKTGRKLVMTGRSVISHARVASSIGALRLPHDLVIETGEAVDLPPHRQMIIVSGTQGEERSALGRVAADSHRHLRVEPGDLVVLSSRFIPGNEVAISRTIDRLLKLGARVIHRGNHPGVHVSGHGSRDEIRAAIEAVSPASFLPAHGTYRHMVANSMIAEEAGVGSTLVAANGQMVSLRGGRLSLVDEPVPVARVFIDNGSSVPEQALRDRRLLGDKGLLHVFWSADGEGRPVSEIHVMIRGVTSEEAIPWFVEQTRDQVESVLSGLGDETRVDRALCVEVVRSALRRFASKTISREPFVLVSILPAGPR